MANELKVAKVLSIQTLRAQGWSQRRIARELGINRETVARHLTAAPERPKRFSGRRIQNQPQHSRLGGSRGWLKTSHSASRVA